jgi:release factor glutamine methyltransferase
MPPTVRQALAQSGLVPSTRSIAGTMGRNRVARGARQDSLTQAQAEAFFTFCRRRVNGEPVPYLTGKREFWGLDLTVTPDVLIPRPETETLVEFALAKLPRDRPVRVLDLGTGSGAIALALAHDRPNAAVLATDSSEAALAVAQGNARRLLLTNAAFAAADWYSGLAPEHWDLIASNPPYVGAVDPCLQEGDLRFEPIASLSSGLDGLAALRVIVGGARDRLVPGGWLVVEHGHDESLAVRELFRTAGFAEVSASRDLAGIPRVVAGHHVAANPPTAIQQRQS